MLGLVKIIVSILSLLIGLGAIYNALGDKNRAMVANWIANWTHAGFDASIPVLEALQGALEPITKAFIGAFNSYGQPIAADIQAAVGPVAGAAFNTSAALLTAKGESTPDNAIGMAEAAMTDAFGFGISSAGVTAAFESVFPEKLNVLNGIGPMLANMAGFDEISAAVRDPLYEAAFGKSLQYHFRSIFKPELPDEGDAVTWHARRLLTDEQLKTIFNYSGLKTEYETPYVDSAYRALQPRAIATLVQDIPFPTQEMKSALEFAGLRDQEVALMLKLLPYSADKNVRNQYLASVIRGGERGDLTTADVDSALTQLEFSDAAKGWVHQTIATNKLIQLSELYRKSVSEAYHYGLITDADYVPNLEAIGIAQADAQAHYAVDSIRKQGQTLLATEKAAARLAAQQKAAAVRAALAEFKAGNIDAPALEAALLIAGVDPSIAAFAVAAATARAQGTKELVAGVLLDRHDAQVLRERISAIEEQTKKKLLDESQALAQLEALGVPLDNRVALVSNWVALAYKQVLPV